MHAGMHMCPTSIHLSEQEQVLRIAFTCDRSDFNRMRDSCYSPR